MQTSASAYLDADGVLHRNPLATNSKTSYDVCGHQSVILTPDEADNSAGDRSRIPSIGHREAEPGTDYLPTR